MPPVPPAAARWTAPVRCSAAAQSASISPEPSRKRRRGNEQAMRRLGNIFGKRNGRVDPVTVEADIEIAAIDPLDGEPVDEFGPCFGRQTVQHVAPGGQAASGPAGRYCGRSPRCAAASRSPAPPPRRRAGRPDTWSDCAAASPGGRTPATAMGRLGEAGRQRTRLAFQAVWTVLTRGAGVNLLAQQGEKALADTLRRARRPAADASRSPAMRARRAMRRRGRGARPGCRRADPHNAV